MKNLFFITVLALTLTACEQSTIRPNTTSVEQNKDNTGINVRDRDTMAKTPLDQSESDSDLAITQKIRQAIVAEDSLSTDAHNIKIITLNGIVTLRGPVASSLEKEAIVSKVKGVEGVTKVDNQLEVIQKN